LHADDLDGFLDDLTVLNHRFERDAQLLEQPDRRRGVMPVALQSMHGSQLPLDQVKASGDMLVRETEPG
jgi:hypothetical protein